MSKQTTVIVVAILAVAGGGAFGASAYAQQKVAAFYDGSLIRDQRIVVRGQADMGVFGGTGAWTAQFKHDLCADEVAFRLRGEDKISFGVNGYRIVSKVYLQEREGNREIFLLHADGQMNWAGEGEVKLTAPAAEHTENRSTVSWTRSTAVARIRHDADEGLQVADWSLKVPNFTLGDVRGTQFAFHDLEMVHQGKAQTWVDNAHSQWRLGKLVYQEAGASRPRLTVEAVKQDVVQTVNGQALDVVGNLTVKSVHYDHNVLNDLTFNGEIKGMNLAALRDWAAFMKREGQACVARAEHGQAFEQLLRGVLQQGVSLSSQGNEIGFNGSKATLNMKVSVPAGQYDMPLNRHGFGDLFERLQYSFNAEFDKALIAGLAQRNGQSISDEEWDKTLAQLPAPMQGVREGDKIRIWF